MSLNIYVYLCLFCWQRKLAKTVAVTTIDWRGKGKGRVSLGVWGGVVRPPFFQSVYGTWYIHSLTYRLLEWRRKTKQFVKQMCQNLMPSNGKLMANKQINQKSKQTKQTGTGPELGVEGALKASQQVQVFESLMQWRKNLRNPAKEKANSTFSIT